MLFGRTQEILYELNRIKENTKDEEFINKYKLLMETPVYVDSPLAKSATEIFKYNEDLGFILDYLQYVKKIITKTDEYYCYNYTLGSTQNKNFYRPGSIETITVTREYLKEVLEKNILWDEKQEEFSYSMTEIYFGSLLNRWKSYKDFAKIYQKIKTTDKYSDKVNLKSRSRIIRFFTVLLKKDRIVGLYIYIKLLEAAKELKQINVYIYNKCFLHNYK